MALTYSTTLRNNSLDELTALIDAGASGGHLIIQGAGPAKLAELRFAATSFAAAGTPSAGKIVANSITADSSATGTGTATGFIMTASAATGTTIVSGTCATSGGDLNLSTVSITAGDTVTVSSFIITDGNP